MLMPSIFNNSLFDEMMDFPFGRDFFGDSGRMLNDYRTGVINHFAFLISHIMKKIMKMAAMENISVVNVIADSVPEHFMWVRMSVRKIFTQNLKTVF